MVAHSVSNVVPSSVIDPVVSVYHVDHTYRLTLARSHPETCDTQREVDDGLVRLVLARDEEQWHKLRDEEMDDVGPLCPRPAPCPVVVHPSAVHRPTCEGRLYPTSSPSLLPSPAPLTPRTTAPPLLPLPLPPSYHLLASDMVSPAVNVSDWSFFRTNLDEQRRRRNRGGRELEGEVGGVGGSQGTGGAHGGGRASPVLSNRERPPLLPSSTANLCPSLPPGRALLGPRLGHRLWNLPPPNTASQV